MASEVIKDGKGLVSIRLNLNAMLNEARADTAKQIFKELEDNIIFIRGDNEDIGISRCSAKRYFTLKKKYNIEE
jgi:hypothetical protein